MRRATALLTTIMLLIGWTVAFQTAVSAQDDQAQLEANKAVVRRYFEALSNGDIAALDEILAPEYTFHSNSGDMTGVEPVKAFAASAKAGVPDATWTVQDLVAEGDYVFVRISVSGTQEAAFSGLPFTGGRIENVPGMGIFKVQDGKLLESWNEDNLLVIGQQLGSAPAPFGVPVFTDLGQPVGPQSDPATREANKAIVRRLLDEAWSQGNLAVIEELYAPDAVNRPVSAGQGPELASVGLQISIFRAGMPDLTATPDIMIAEGDEVATHVVLSGTDTGGMFGFPPSGKSISTGGIRVDRIKDGKIVETWFIVDMLRIFQEIGAIPSAAATPTS